MVNLRAPPNARWLTTAVDRRRWGKIAIDRRRMNSGTTPSRSSWCDIAPRQNGPEPKSAIGRGGTNMTGTIGWASRRVGLCLVLVAWIGGCGSDSATQDGSAAKGGSSGHDGAGGSGTGGTTGGSGSGGFPGEG